MSAATRTQLKKLKDEIEDIGTRIEIAEGKAVATYAEEAGAYYGLRLHLRSRQEELKEKLVRSTHGRRAS